MNVIFNPRIGLITLTEEMVIAELMAELNFVCSKEHSPAKMGRVLTSLISLRAQLFKARFAYLAQYTTIQLLHSPAQINEHIRKDILLSLPEFSKLYEQLVAAIKQNFGDAQGWETALNSIEQNFAKFEIRFS